MARGYGAYEQRRVADNGEAHLGLLHLVGNLRRVSVSMSCLQFCHEEIRDGRDGPLSSPNLQIYKNSATPQPYSKLQNSNHVLRSRQPKSRSGEKKLRDGRRFGSKSGMQSGDASILRGEIVLPDVGGILADRLSAIEVLEASR